MRAWLVIAVLLSVMASPVFLQPPVLEESCDDVRHSSPIQATISPTSGWTSGGEEIPSQVAAFLIWPSLT